MIKIKLLENQEWLGFEVTPLDSCNYYIFEGEKDNLVRKFLDQNVPEKVKSSSKLGIAIKKAINADGRSTTKAQEEDFEKAMKKLQKKYKKILKKRKQKEEQEKTAEEENLKEKIRNCRFFFDNIENPLHFIACLTDWFCAGERMNTTLAFVIYASQIVLKEPISMVSVGDSSSGKSKIFQTALEMLPDEFIIYDKRPTFQSMVNRSIEDEYYYDGKIVYLGDMGGEDDKSEAMACLDLIKELQTDGRLSTSKNIRVGNDWVPTTLTLKGFPCLSYTTVPDFNFDNQELSRMIKITPKTFENIEVYKRMNTSLELKGKSFIKQNEYKEVLKQVPYLLLSLREEFTEIDVVNPYYDFLMDFLKKSEHFKRDSKKYNSLLKIITVLNGFNREKYEYDGRKQLIVTKNDLCLFKQILERYLDNIVLNISKNASLVLRSLEKMLGWDDYNGDTDGTTINEYVDSDCIQMNKKTIQNAFSELYQAGYLTINGKEGRSNIYRISSKDRSTFEFKDIKLKEEVRKSIIYERGEEYLELIENKDSNIVNLNSQHKDVEKPVWEA